jgi:CubicO group peptidase (beta-lactamase class C family)
MQEKKAPRGHRARGGFVAAIFLVAAALAGCDDGKAGIPANKEELSELTEGLRRSTGLPSLALAIMDPSGNTLLSAEGKTRAGGDQAVTEKSLYHLGSLSKAFTALLVASLVEEGRLGYEWSLERALPGYPMRDEYRRASVADLMLGRSGLMRFINTAQEEPERVMRLWMEIPAAAKGDARAQRSEMARFALSLPSEGEPGRAGPAYSNIGWSVLGHIAELAAGKPYEEALGERVLEPLGIEGFKLGGWPSDEYSDIQPLGHFPSQNPFSGPRPHSAADGYELPAWMNPAGGLSLDIRGLGAFAADQLAGLKGGGRILGPSGYARLHEVGAETDAASFFGSAGMKGRIRIAQGWYLYGDGPSAIHAADGTAGTFYAAVAILPDRGYALAGATNSGAGEQALAKALKRILGAEL